MLQRFRSIVRAITATTYLASLVTCVVVLVYALLTVLDRVPSYATLALGLGVPTTWLLVAVYLFVTAIIALMWHQAAGRPAADPLSQQQWRWVYRQTDRAGLWLIDAVLVAVVVGGAFWARGSSLQPYVGEGPDFLAAMVLIPTLMSYFPWRRPRRYIVRRDGETLEEVADHWVPLIPGGQRSGIAGELAFYNELEHRAGYTGVSGQLPEGLVIEVPPRFGGEP